ncbi:MAG TPA: small basic protein [Planctomicrobium sp.]|nr:small basic protein [Planctomicrobium sp.]
MSIDKSLRRGSRLSRSRNVLKRDERIQKLKEDDRWTDATSPLGLPKVRVQKLVLGKKKKEKKEEEPAAKGKKK